MADPSTCPPLTRASVLAAHAAIKPLIHRTPVATSTTLSAFASAPQRDDELEGASGYFPDGDGGASKEKQSGEEEHGEAGGGKTEAKPPAAKPTMRLFFKCENQQRVGAFKARGAFHALSRLSDEQLARGVVTHSSGTYSPPPSQNLQLPFPNPTQALTALTPAQATTQRRSPSPPAPATSPRTS